MSFIGISAGFHDAAITVIDSSGNITFASHSERYSKLKHDRNLCPELLHAALPYSENVNSFHYYEKPWLKYLRQLRSGEKCSLSNIFAKNILGNQFTDITGAKKIITHGHHLSHAAAGFQTSPYRDATIVVVDAIGEFDTATIWQGWYDQNGYAKYKKLWSKKYPNSIGLFYTAMTKHVGLKPLDEEYILMGMAAYGKPVHVDEMRGYFLDNPGINFKINLHAGVPNDLLQDTNNMDIACSSQHLLEELLSEVFSVAKKIAPNKNLVYMGGVALNCLANRLLSAWFDNIWIMPNPGDAGSSLGAAALGWGKRVNWVNAYLGHEIAGEYPVNNLVQHLYDYKIAGVASGRAEFGPRALGNRSLLADPRGHEIKDKVNAIKRRQKFRPFAPVVLEEFANTYFRMPSGWVDSRYMQIVAPCLAPELFPAVVHADGTSRIQTVPRDGSGIRLLLEEWYKKTGCPLLLNTSLNIRGEPMVNDRSDADRFEKMYGIRVFS